MKLPVYRTSWQFSVILPNSAILTHIFAEKCPNVQRPSWKTLNFQDLKTIIVFMPRDGTTFFDPGQLSKWDDINGSCATKFSFQYSKFESVKQSFFLLNLLVRYWDHFFNNFNTYSKDQDASMITLVNIVGNEKKAV